jgi:hypothetical protein
MSALDYIYGDDIHNEILHKVYRTNGSDYTDVDFAFKYRSTTRLQFSDIFPGTPQFRNGNNPIPSRVINVAAELKKSLHSGDNIRIRAELENFIDKYATLCKAPFSNGTAPHRINYNSHWHERLFNDSRTVILFVFDGVADSNTVENLMGDILFQKFGRRDFKIGEHPLVLVWLHDWKLSSWKIQLERDEFEAQLEETNDNLD